MIRRLLRRLSGFLSSARVATLLIAFVGVWAVLASFIPQEATSAARVAAWSKAHPLAESVARALGLHQAFSAPLFRIAVMLLVVSMALCAWQRTKAAIAKARALRSALHVDAEELADRNDTLVSCDPDLSEADTLEIAAETLRRVGIKPSRNGSVVSAVSRSWTVWGSPVFHWALLALVVALALSNFMRSSGQIGLGLGESKVDEPASYGILSTGPLHRWGENRRAIRLDAFDRRYKTEGVDRGPTPTVTVLNADGKVVRSQRVYPNHTLKTGSLTIYPVDFGLSATVSLVDSSGTELGRASRLVDFSEESTQGNRPLGYLTVNGASGHPDLKLFLTVPLDRRGSQYLKQVPAEPKVRILATTMDNKRIFDRVVRQGEDLRLPTGGALRLVGVTYYARLQLVDDPAIPLMYAALFVVAIGLGVATLVRQQIILAAYVQSPDGPRLALRIRLWRNASTSRSEIESELARALGRTDERSTT